MGLVPDEFSESLYAANIIIVIAIATSSNRLQWALRKFSSVLQMSNNAHQGAIA